MAGEQQSGALNKSSGPLVKVFACPNCGASVTIRAVGLSVSAVCPSCKSLSAVGDSNLTIIQKAKANVKIEPLIPIGVKGRLRGEVYQVIGYMVRFDID